MSDVAIGKGQLAGKGVYAARNFVEGEQVMSWNLKKLTQAEFNALPKSEHMFVHSFWGKMYLFPEPSRYTNHCANPNTKPDLLKMCDYAIRGIKKGEMITTNATLEVRNELETFIETIESAKIKSFKWLKGGYRNAICTYEVRDFKKRLNLKRINGNWQILNNLESKKS